MLEFRLNMYSDSYVLMAKISSQYLTTDQCFLNTAKVLNYIVM